MPRPFVHTVLLALAVVALAASSASAIVLYPGDAGATNKPADSVMARWNSNASAVVIGPNLVLTTTHQGGGVGSVVNVGGTNYTVAEIWNEPTGADIRVARLSGANLSDYAHIYTGSDEVGMAVTIGGFGRGRGAALYDTNNEIYGYAWDSSQTYNSTLRWGENRVVDTDTNGVSELLIDTFSSPTGGYALPHESAIALWDSGGGWLYNSGTAWYVVGLSRAVTHLNESWFRDPSTGATDINDAVRVSAYAGWLATVPEPMTLGALALGGAWVLGRRRAKAKLETRSTKYETI